MSMRIALVYDLIYPYSKGGVEKRLRGLALHLARRGHEVHLYGTKDWAGPDHLEEDGIHLHGVKSPTTIHARHGRRSIRQALVYAAALSRILTRERYDIVDVQNMAPLAALAALIATRASNSTSVVTWHEVWRGHWTEHVGLVGHMGRLAELALARWATNHVAVSEGTRRQLIEMGVKQVALIPNGVDCDIIRAAPINPVAPDVIYVGRLAAHKNLELLIDATAVLRSRGLAPTVTLVGEGPAREQLESKVRTEKLDTVTFMGSVHDEHAIYSLLRSARVFALPSTREGFGLAALEAAAAGLPVVTVDHPLNGATELVVGRSTGLATPSSPHEFASALHAVMYDEDLGRMLREGAQNAAAYYDWSRVAPMAESEYLRFRDSSMNQQN
jgi:L-malate glycosyltransferase